MTRPGWRLLGGCALGFVIATAIALSTSSGVASAHAFLVSSSPPEGARLDRPPSAIVMRFTERVVIGATTVKVRVGTGGEQPPVSVAFGGDAYTVRVALVGAPSGIYQVSWQTLSADDGHTSDGEFAFAAGPVSGAVPASAEGASGQSATGLIGTVLFLIGLAAGLSGALTAAVVDSRISTRSPGLRVGLLVAAIGAGLVFVHDVTGQSGGVTHASRYSGGAVFLVAAAMFVNGRSSRAVPVVVLLSGAGVAWAGQLHPAISGGGLGLAINSVHLVVGAAWVGLLGYLVAAVIHGRRNREALITTVGRYARLALPMVLVLAAAGGISALEVLPTWSSIYDSGYGQLLLVKTGLFAAALGLAAVGRQRGLRQAQPSTLARSVPIEAVAVGVIVIVTAVLANTAPPARPEALGELIGPAPLSGPVARSAGLAGQLTVGVAASSGELQLQLIAPDSSPLSNVDIDIDAFTPDGRDIGLFPRACGNGCFTEHYGLPDGTTRLVIATKSAAWTGGTLTADVTWPPTNANPDLLAQVVARMDQVPSVVTRETVTSNSQGRSFTQTLGGTTGEHLMTFEPYGSQGDESGQTTTITDVQPLPLGAPGLTLYLPGEPLWATIWLDPQGRIARQQIVSIGHLITDVFDYPPA